MNEQSQLLSLLNDAFSTQEIRGLLIDLGEDPDKFAAPDAARDKLAQETVLHFKRRKQLPVLAEGMARVRPDLAEELASFVPPAVGGQSRRMVAGGTRPWGRWLAVLGLVIVLGLLTWFAGSLIIPPTPPASNITVEVRDALTLEPLANAQVMLSYSGGYAPDVGFTDDNGIASFRLNGALQGTTGQVTVDLDGYGIKTETKNFVSGLAPIPIRLTPSP